MEILRQDPIWAELVDLGADPFEVSQMLSRHMTLKPGEEGKTLIMPLLVGHGDISTLRQVELVWVPDPELGRWVPDRVR